MKITLMALSLALLSSAAFGALSLNPQKVVTPLINIFSDSNRILGAQSANVSVTTFNNRGVLRLNGERKIIAKSLYEKLKSQAEAVYQMIPKENQQETTFRMGTAFHIGSNLVLTNHHVLSVSRSNLNRCDDFQLKVRNTRSSFYKCKKVHFCSPERDLCLIEMESRSRNRKYSLDQGPALKLRAHLDSVDSEQEILTAIGNSMGLAIHASQGRGTSLSNFGRIFYAPLTQGNSGGPLLNSEGVVVGLVRAQSNSADPKLVNDVGPNAFNVAVPMDIVIDTIRQSGALDPETLEKFNASVIE